MRNRPGFTLIELLVVITIIITVSVVTLPMVLPALNHREVSAAARIVQGALVGARDAAIRDNSPSGIRLLPDPAQANAYNRMIPLMTPPSYSEGLVNSFPGETGYSSAVTLGTLALVLEEAPGEWVLPLTGPPYVWKPNPPTSWQWNVRVGDKVQINGAGEWYTVIGPMVIPPAGITWTDNNFYANSEAFTNVGPPGSQSPLQRTYTSKDGKQSITLNPDYLLLMNGRDDNQDGMIDLAWNGIDDNGIGGPDDPTEWSFSCQVTPPSYTYARPINLTPPIPPAKTAPATTITVMTTVESPPYTPAPEREVWLEGAAAQSAYTIRRRPVPGANAREVPFPGSIVIDASRSKIQINPLTNQVDIIVKPDGSMLPALLYSTPASVPLDGSFFQLWLAERGDMGSFQQLSPAPAPLTWVQSTPAGQWWLLCVNAKTGNIVSLEQADPVTGYSLAMQGGNAVVQHGGVYTPPKPKAP